ncbi:4-hydroxy-tetrahydrodipicolinate synthase [candidate division WOR-3 bacterium]|nr:4-hydroxy-tetrahydrodipicolinate synthase [candidate division WOR-3 bacterium]
MFEFCTVAMITPFSEGKIDMEGVRKNIDFYVRGDVSGILIAGTTGESPTLTEEEYQSLANEVVHAVNKRAKVMLNAGTNSTQKSLKNLSLANKIGVDAVLAITPYYNKPNHSGMKEHFVRIASETDLPVYIYNVPSRTGVNIDIDLVVELRSENKNIAGIKEAGGNIDRFSDMAQKIDGGFEILSGDDNMTLPSMSVGAKGVISVSANIIPAEVSKMTKVWSLKNPDTAREIHLKFFQLTKLLFVETNPVPVKTAMRLMGLPSGELRLPLGEMSEKNAQLLKAELGRLGLV